MSESKMQEIHDKLSHHSYEIETLKSSTSELVDTIKESTKSMNELATSFALSAQKHDENKKDIDKMDAKIDVHSEKIALMLPTVESLRGMVWKLVGAMFLGVSGSAAIVASIVKMG